MKKIVSILKISTVFIILLMAFSNISNADMGPKPSITVKLKNMNTNNYIIDLFVFDEDGSKYNDKADYNGSGLTHEEIEILHSLNYDGWISEGTRWNSYLLFAECAGNELNKHTFSYFGTPETYRVFVWNKNTGEMKLSNILNRTDFTSIISMDIDEMTIQQTSSIKLIIYTILKAELLTLIIEIVVALIMKFKHFKIIILVNLCTNFILQILLMILPIPYYIAFGILELLVIFAEYMIYKKFIKDESNKKIIAYTIIGNLMSGIIIPFIIQFVSKIIILLKDM